MSESPQRGDVYPALVRSSKDGTWKLKQNFVSDETKLSPRRGGELREIRHTRPPPLGPDPQNSLMANKKVTSLKPFNSNSNINNNNNNRKNNKTTSLSNVAARNSLLSSSSSSSYSGGIGTSPRSSFHNNEDDIGGGRYDYEDDEQDDDFTRAGSGFLVKFGRRKQSTNNTHDNNKKTTKQKTEKRRGWHHRKEKQQEEEEEEEEKGEDDEYEQEGGGSSPTRSSRLDADLNFSAIPLTAEATNKSLQAFEERLIRLDLRKPDEMQDPAVESRSETPIDTSALLVAVAAPPATSAPTTTTSATALGRRVSPPSLNNRNTRRGSVAPPSGLSINTSNLPVDNNNNNNNNDNNNIPASPALSEAASLYFSQYKEDTNNSQPPRPWETTSSERAKNPFFGLCKGKQSYELRDIFLKVEKEFAQIRTRGLSSPAFLRFLNILAPNIVISEQLLNRAMSYFECQTSVVSSSDPSSPLSVRRTVTFPQVVIRYGADHSPRWTDAAVVACFGALGGAGTVVSKIPTNSAILISDIKSSEIRRWCKENTTSNSIARKHWVAIADALDKQETQQEISALVDDVVHRPPVLHRSQLEERIFGNRLPNGALIPSAPLITLDQWRYVAYASKALLPLLINLRNVVEHPETDPRKLFAEKQ